MDTNQTASSIQTETIENMVPKVPIGVKIIAVLFYIVSALLIFVGIIQIFTHILIFSFAFDSLLSMFGFVGFKLSLLDKILVIALGILHFIAGRGLWTGKEWGQVLGITINGLNIAVWIIRLAMSWHTTGFGYFFSALFFALYLGIILYLLFSKKVNAIFFQNKSKRLSIILPIIAVTIFAPITIKSYRSQVKAKEFIQYIQNTEQAIQQSDMDCTFYEGSNQALVPINTQSGKDVYNNSLYSFKIDISQAYIMKEFKGTNYCEDVFIFYKPEDARLFGQGRLISISVQPARGNLDYEFNYAYKLEKNIQKSNIQLAGQPGLKVVNNLVSEYINTRLVEYMVVYQGKLYKINKLNALSAEQFDTVIGSFSFNRE